MGQLPVTGLLVECKQRKPASVQLCFTQLFTHHRVQAWRPEGPTSEPAVQLAHDSLQERSRWKPGQPSVDGGVASNRGWHSKFPGAHVLLFGLTDLMV